MNNPDTSTKELREKLDKILKDYYLYMRYHDTKIPDNTMSHTVVKTSINDASKLQEATAQAIISLATQALQSAKKDCERGARIDELEKLQQHYGEFSDDTTGVRANLKAVTLYRIKARLAQLQ